MTVVDLDLSLMIPALLAGILVLSTHVPLGQEVLKRGIIFIDLAIAQIAALGVIASVVFGGERSVWQIEVFAGISALIGAGLIYYLEQHYRESLEAIIGLLFVLAASGSLLLISFAPHSDALLHDLLIGQILWVNSTQLLWIAGLYSLLLIIWFCSKQKSSLLFYLVFSLTVTASVQLVGIYLVFASLILPALMTQHITSPLRRLLSAYSIGFLGYLFGLLCSLAFDLPTGAIIVWTLLLTAFLTKPIVNRNLIR
jgi:zinc/manganese transport system permease protein